MQRREIIDLALNDLNEFKDKCAPRLRYAVDENIKFFEVAKSLRKFIPWLLGTYQHIDRERI
ncbi:MAG: hypothetical protein Q8P73_04640, partial [bacterium]|nr:hypothetical protein [bacterium]